MAEAFLRQYLPIGKSFYVFADEGLSATIGNSENRFSETTETTMKSTDIDLYFYPCIVMGKRCQVEVSYNRLFNLGYHRLSDDYRENGASTRNSKSNTISMQAGSSDNPLLGLTLGFRWVIQ